MADRESDMIKEGRGLCIESVFGAYCEKMYYIDVEDLIALVAEKPVIWDKTSEIYKDRCATKSAWIEIFRELNDDFDAMDDADKNAYGKAVMKKWGNVRDSFLKSEKKPKYTKSGRRAQKPYVYGAQLQFLKKTWKFQDPNTEDSLTSFEIQKPKEIEDKAAPENRKTAIAERNRTNLRKIQPRKRKLDPVELQLIQAIKGEPNRHLSFFQGIIPSLDLLDDEEIIEFQISVLQTLSTIKQRKKKNNQNVASTRLPKNTQSGMPSGIHTYSRPSTRTLEHELSPTHSIASCSSDISETSNDSFDFAESS